MKKTVRFIALAAALVGLFGFTGCTKKKKGADSGGAADQPSATERLSPIVLSGPISSLNSGPYVSSSQLTIVTGTCQTGAVVTISGDADDTIDCLDGSFSTELETSADGTFNYSFIQNTTADNSSFPTTLQWIRDTAPPSAPTLTTPNNNPLNSNGSSVALAGLCETNTTVMISGDLASSTLCTNSAFSFNLDKSDDGVYNYSVSQTDLAGNTSQSSSFIWHRDTVAPSAPTVSYPLSNPYISSDTTFTLTGACENNALVSLNGSLTDATTCSEGVYSFPISKPSDFTYNFSISQTDQSGNVSATKSFQWVRDTSLPDTPRITVPSLASYSSNSSSLTISGTCSSGNTVLLSGAASSSGLCSSNLFSFLVEKSSDAPYSFSIKQRNLAGTESGETALSWTRDTVNPQSPSIQAPGSSPIYSNSSLQISGNCEIGASVKLTGAATDSTTCLSDGTNGVYTFLISKSVDSDISGYTFKVGQTDLAGNDSLSGNDPSMTWHFDTLIPNPPTVTNHSSPFISKDNTLTLSGACELNAAVNISGSFAGSATCVAGTYSISLIPEISTLTEGPHDLNISQTDLAENTSTNTQFTWIRDTSPPDSPIITSPSTSAYTSADPTLAISGSCESDATVYLSLSGSDIGNALCESNSFSIDVSRPDGIWNFAVRQVDLAGNASLTPASLQWTRDSSIPSNPIITTPSSSQVYSNGNNLTIEGTCITGNSVEISGSASSSYSCSAGIFTFMVSASADGSYSFNLKQKSPSAIYSGAETITWIRDTALPTPLTATSPAQSPFYSNSATMSVSGNCETGASVYISIDGSSTADTQTCSAGSYSFNLDINAIQGNITYVVSQADIAGNYTLTPVSQIWVRDSVAPATPTVTSPDTGDTYIYASGDTNLTLSGVCEANNTVTISGDTATTNTTCSSDGYYNFSVSALVDGPYNFYLKQKDLANNESTTQTFQWYRDTSTPSTPSVSATGLTLLSGSTFIYRSNTASITIAATCDSTLVPFKSIVSLSGDVDPSEVTSPAGTLSQQCLSGSVNFVVAKSADSTESVPYTFSVSQTNPNSSLSSAETSIQWIKDTVSPDAPTIDSPPTSPYTTPDNSLTISGVCENADATVALDETTSGSPVNLENQNCSASNAYSFTVTKTVNGTYIFEVKQTDLANNTSSSTPQTWTRDSTLIASPTITVPAAATTYSKLSSGTASLTLSGGCITGYTVRLFPEGSTTPLQSTVCSSSLYSFSISKTADGTYKFYVKQTVNPGVDERTSALIGPKTWMIDSVAPVTTITGQNPKLSSTSATLSFTTVETGSGVSGYQCKLDTGSWASCTSPKTYTSLSNGSHSFYVKATDNSTNTETDKTFIWDQRYYKAVALYHLNSTAPTTDSSSYTSTATCTNTLSAVGTITNDTTGKLPTSALSSSSFGSGSNYYSAASNACLNLGLNVLTIEGFVKLTSVTTTTGNYYTLISKTGNTSPDFGWEVRLRKSATAGKFLLDFVASTNGTTAGTVDATNTTDFTVNANTWYYFAITYNAGSVKRYFSSAAGGTNISKIGTTGSMGTALASTTAPLRVGAGPTSGTGASLFLTGSVDEIRFSQFLRANATGKMTIPSAEFGAD